MKLEIPIRWIENVTDPEAVEEARVRRIISGDDEESPLGIGTETKFVYDLLVCDISDIVIFHRFDDENTIIKMDTGDSFCVGIPYETFKELYMDVTGESIKTVTLIPNTPLDNISL